VIGAVRRRLARLGGAIGLGLVVVVATAGPAWAHASLVESDPGAGAVLVDAPRSVDLRFSESVTVEPDGVRLFDGDGARVATGTPATPTAREVRVPIRASLADGAYVVTWRVTSADTHPVRGAFTFTVGQASGPGAADPSILADRLLQDQGGDPAVGAAWAVVRWLAFVGIAVLVGGLVFVVAIWPGARDQTRTRRIVTAGWAVLVVATVLGFVLRGPYVAAEGLDRVLDVGRWGEIAGTRFGVVWLVRLGLLAVTGFLLHRCFAGPSGERRTLPQWWTVTTAVVLVAICATPALSGHPAGGDLVAVATVLDAVHVTAMAVWLGGLVLMGAVVVRGDDPDGRRAVVERFSRIAFWCVAALVATGAFATWRDVRTLTNLRETDFGHILVVKVAIFALMVVFAAFSREVVARLFRRPAPGVADDGLEGDGDGGEPLDLEALRQREWRSLRRSVWTEAVIGLAVLAATAALVNAAPASGIVAGANQGVAGVTMRDRLVTVDVAVTPGRVGVDDVHVNVFSPQGTPFDAKELTVTIDLPARGIAPIAVPLRRLGPGHYLSPGFTIPLSGSWRVTAKALVSDVDLVTLTGRVPIG